MLLVKVVPDASMIASGYERYTFQCLGCYEVENHLVYCERASRLAERSPSISALTLACTEHEKDLDESEALLNRAIAIVRGPVMRRS
jgi:hypothetical protein